MEELFEKTQQYVKHVHDTRWQDEQFRACRDTFPIGTILSVADFAENYTPTTERDSYSILSLRLG